MYAKIKELPPSIQSALMSIGWTKPDIEVCAHETFTLNPGTAFAGSRGFTCAVNLATGESKNVLGAWGGANQFEATIDHDDSPRPILPNMAVIQGEIGGRGCFGRIKVAPATLAGLLPAPSAELTEDQAIVLACFKRLKSFARRENAERCGVAQYDDTVRSLADMGYVKINAAGAASITTEGKNALSGVKLPRRASFL